MDNFSLKRFLWTNFFFCWEIPNRVELEDAHQVDICRTDGNPRTGTNHGDRPKIIGPQLIVPIGPLQLAWGGFPNSGNNPAEIII